MEKIRLDVDELRVESFPAEEKKEPERGTVLGHATALCDQSVPVYYCISFGQTFPCG